MNDPVQRVDERFIEEQLGEDYNRFGAKVRSLHARLLQSVQRPEDVALDIDVGHDGLCTVTVCASDSVGALSIISGLFSAHHLDIVSVDAFTLTLPQSTTEDSMSMRDRRRYMRRLRREGRSRSSRRILDVFEVRPLDAFDPGQWERFEDDLKGLISLLVSGHQETARTQVMDMFSEAVRALGDADTQLFPVSVQLTDDESSDCTRLTIRSADTLGFLFEFANALTMLNVNIDQAEIRTIRGEVRDTFLLTDAAGNRIESENKVHELRVVAALIKQFTHLLPRSPNPSMALHQFNALTHQMLSNPDWTAGLRDLESESVLETLADMMGVSRFLWEDFLRMQHENLFPVLLDAPSLDERKPIDEIRREFHDELEGITEHDRRIEELNKFKDREMFRIDLRHITNRIGFRAFSDELSDLAEIVVGEAAELSHRMLTSDYGTPMLEAGASCPWAVCALGKFGGRELGFGSDIELIFVYEREGITDGPDAMENSRYFGEFVRTFLTTLITRREGIFEIDLRLKPYGTKGPLASALEEFTGYYSQDGPARQFERMALVKLRPVAGNRKLGAHVTKLRDAYVYSGTALDVDNILHLRHRQATELVPPEAVSAKYSAGGLVDLEYYVQGCQITAGHLDKTVRVTNTLDAIDRLAQGEYLQRSHANDLRDAYAFMRRLIDGLRAVRGHAKDLTIPAMDSPEFAYLTQRLQFESTEELSGAIAVKMDFARSVWDNRSPLTA